jgi:hypothetical protein
VALDVQTDWNSLPCFGDTALTGLGDYPAPGIGLLLREPKLNMKTTSNRISDLTANDPSISKNGLEALLTPDNCVLLLIDHQAFQFAGLRSHDTQTIINNVVGLAKSAIDIHEFKDGKIVRTWHSEDWMTGLHQLGFFEK